MLGGLITICGGILAASALIIARKPSAKQLIEKLTPYQGWIGAVMFFWGIWETFGALRHVGYIAQAPLMWTFWAATGVADLVVGFLLAFGLITKYALDKNEVTKKRGEQIRLKLAPYQGLFGLLAVCMGTLYIAWIYVV